MASASGIRCSLSCLKPQHNTHKCKDKIDSSTLSTEVAEVRRGVEDHSTSTFDVKRHEMAVVSDGVVQNGGQGEQARQEHEHFGGRVSFVEQC